MSQLALARWSGFSLMLGGALFTAASFSQLQPGSHYSFHGIFGIAVTMVIPAILLLALGLAGLRAQYASRLNRLGRWGLGIAIAGAIIKGLTFGGIAFSDVLFTVSIAAFALHLFGVLLFGVSAVQTKALPRWNALPIIIGLLPALRFLNPNAGEVFGPQYAPFASIALMGLGYVLLGYMMYSTASRHQVAAVG